MPRVVPEYKEEARRRILRAARDAFSEKGYHETRMEDIAKKVGVSKRTLYLYFENKEELFRAMIAGIPEAVRELLRACLGTRDFETACRSFFDASTAEPVAGLNFEILAAATRDPALRKIQRELYESEIDVLAEFLERLKASGDLARDADAKRTARALLALYDGLMADLVLGVKKAEVRQAWVEAAARMLR